MEIHFLLTKSKSTKSAVKCHILNQLQLITFCIKWQVGLAVFIFFQSQHVFELN